MKSTPSSHSLDRFLAAQQPVYAAVLAELRAGAKRSHWMWFIFPQIEGLGASPMARHYALKGTDEARAFLDHPTLGARLRECVQLALDANVRSITELLPYPDDLKFRSCLTLFAHVAPRDPLLIAALDRYFGGERDPLTLERLSEAAAAMPSRPVS